MTTINVPAHVAAIAEMDATAAASAVTTGLRSTGTTMSDVAEWITAHGAPDDWTGDAAEAADHAMTGYAGTPPRRPRRSPGRRRLRPLRRPRRRAHLRARGPRVPPHAPQPGHRRPALQDRAVHRRRHRGAEAESRRSAPADRLVDDITALWDDVTAAEDRLIAAFQAVDTAGEGADAAARDTTDIGALREELTALGGDPDAINEWLEGLTRAEQEALKISDPDLVGNTNGIPTGDRDEANRTSLDRDLDRLTATQEAGDELTTAEQRLLDRARPRRPRSTSPPRRGCPTSTATASATRSTSTCSSTSPVRSAATARWRSATATPTPPTTRP